jgi:LAO/AO transport system kinase
MAARDRLGGLSDAASAGVALMAAVYDRVLVESVGIGQSEADVATVADTVVLCIQPGSGDSVQFMKAGVMELPDIVAVTKADTGAPARRAVADVAGALSLSTRPAGAWTPAVLAASSTTGEGIDALIEAVETHRPVGTSATLRDRRRRAALAESVRARYGAAGLAAVDVDAVLATTAGPFTAYAEIAVDLDRRLGSRDAL